MSISSKVALTESKGKSLSFFMCISLKINFFKLGAFSKSYFANAMNLFFEYVFFDKFNSESTGKLVNFMFETSLAVSFMSDISILVRDSLLLSSIKVKKSNLIKVCPANNNSLRTG